MGATSRREFLKSSAVAMAIGSGAFAAVERPTLAGSTDSSSGSTLKKGLVYSMLPSSLSHGDRFKLARNTGFEVVQAPTTADPREAEEIQRAAKTAGIRIDSVMNMDH